MIATTTLCSMLTLWVNAVACVAVIVLILIFQHMSALSSSCVLYPLHVCFILFHVCCILFPTTGGPLAASSQDAALTYAVIAQNDPASFYSQLYDGGVRGPPAAHIDR